MQLFDTKSQIVIGNSTVIVENKEVVFEIYDEKTDFYKCILKIKLATLSFDRTLAEKDEFYLVLE